MTVIAVLKVFAGLIALALVLLPLLAAVAAIRDGVRRLIRGRGRSQDPPTGTSRES